MSENIRPLYRPRAEVHAELAATVERPRYVSESEDDALTDASVWVAMFGMAAVFVVFCLTLVAALYGAYRFSDYLNR